MDQSSALDISHKIRLISREDRLNVASLKPITHSKLVCRFRKVGMTRTSMPVTIDLPKPVLLGPLANGIAFEAASQERKKSVDNTYQQQRMNLVGEEGVFYYFSGSVANQDENNGRVKSGCSLLGRRYVDHIPLSPHLLMILQEIQRLCRSPFRTTYILQS